VTDSLISERVWPDGEVNLVSAEHSMMTWRSTPWVRWLGWTLLYGLALFGATVVADRFDRLEPWILGLVGFVLAVLIGVRFRTDLTRRGNAATLTGAILAEKEPIAFAWRMT
jgi:hypothetical protein